MNKFVYISSNSYLYSLTHLTIFVHSFLKELIEGVLYVFREQSLPTEYLQYVSEVSLFIFLCCFFLLISLYWLSDYFHITYSSYCSKIKRHFPKQSLLSQVNNIHLSRFYNCSLYANALFECLLSFVLYWKKWKYPGTSLLPLFQGDSKYV